MHYKRYRLRSPLFALRNPRLSEQVLATFAGAAAQRPVSPMPVPAARAPRTANRGQ